MAAYGALLSLTTTLNNIQIHPRVSTFFDHKHIQSLHQIINFLLHFMESNREEEEEDLERQIASTTHAVEDVIESHLVHQILAKTEASNLNYLDLEKHIHDMNYLKQTVVQFQGTTNFKDDSFSPEPSSKPLTTTNNNFLMVGFNEKLIKIMDRLTGPKPDLQIVPIVGMGGIGKTTLAKGVHDNLLIVESFDIRAWVTISQEYCVKNVLFELLSCIQDTKINKSIGAVKFDIDLETEDHELGLKLHQTLSGRRYLIVLDDMWSVEAWYMIKNFFPNNNNRSRVVITTRISSVATPLSSLSFEMDFLDEDRSWELFCKNVFLEKRCPSELEKIGKKIVRECKGLPLSIVVVGRLLRKSRSTCEYWENFARHLNSILMSGNDVTCLNILSLSYNHLPVHLKPCFLYMGIFREDKKIRVSTLISLLVAEGFLKPKEGLTMEEVAYDYLCDLVDRNLIFADSWEWNGSIKYCKMHDLVREVCLKIGGKEKIFQKMSKHEIPADINRVRRIVFHGYTYSFEDSKSLPSASLARTFLTDGGPLPFKSSQLLRVLSHFDISSQKQVFKHVNLRYLLWSLRTKNGNSKLPSSVSLLWNVHTFIFTGGKMEAPSEIWYMRQLRHLESSEELYLPDPPPSEQDDALLPNLHTLANVYNLSFTEEVCKGIPNVKHLGIIYTELFWEECKKKCCFYLDRLSKLQSLYCYFKVPKRDVFLQSLKLPSSLTKLSLQNCGLHWEDINTFGFWLPHLQVLKLHDDAVVGPEWDCVEEAFPCLKILLLRCPELIKWSAESSNCFPVLEKLQLIDMEELEMIPSDMGQVQTLGSIRVRRCSLSATIASVEILKEQLHFENEDFQLVLQFKSNKAKKKFMEKVKIDSFTIKNFKLIS